MTEPEIRKKLLARGGRLLGRRPYSRAELRLKLLPLAAEADVDSALDRLEELNLLNDADYAYNFAFRRASQEGWGPLKLRQALQRRRIAPDLVESTLDRVGREVEANVALREYVERRCRRSGWPADRRGIQKLVDHLRRRGFHEESIVSALRHLIPPAVWQRFNTGD